MNTLQVSVEPESSVVIPSGMGAFYLDAVYTRAISGDPSPGVADLPNAVQETARASLDDTLRGSFPLADVAGGGGSNASSSSAQAETAKSAHDTQTAVLPGLPEAAKMACDRVES